jgi:hypothetical protein
MRIAVALGHYIAPAKTRVSDNPSPKVSAVSGASIIENNRDVTHFIW